MAERRMFAKTIIDSDAFLDMPSSAQALYFHLSMRADDEGFINNPKKIQRMIGASADDMKILIAKNFVIPFDSGVVVIKHWKIHNYIRKDRLIETKYKEEKDLLTVKENGAYTLAQGVLSVTCQSHVSHMSDTCQPNGGIGKDRLGKDRIGKDRLGEVREGEHEGKDKTDYKKIVGMYNDTCVSFPRVANTNLSDNRKKAIKARLNKYSEADFQTLFTKAEASDFLKGANNRNWRATFDWLIKDTNMEKVLEGNYDNRQQTWTQKPTNRLAQELEESYRMMAEWAAQDEGGTDQ